MNDRARAFERLIAAINESRSASLICGYLPPIGEIVEKVGSYCLGGFGFDGYEFMSEVDYDVYFVSARVTPEIEAGLFASVQEVLEQF